MASRESLLAGPRPAVSGRVRPYLAQRNHKSNCSRHVKSPIATNVVKDLWTKLHRKILRVRRRYLMSSSRLLKNSTCICQRRREILTSLRSFSSTPSAGASNPFRRQDDSVGRGSAGGGGGGGGRGGGGGGGGNPFRRSGQDNEARPRQAQGYQDSGPEYDRGNGRDGVGGRSGYPEGGNTRLPDRRRGSLEEAIRSVDQRNDGRSPRSRDGGPRPRSGRMDNLAEMLLSEQEGGGRRTRFRGPSSPEGRRSPPQPASSRGRSDTASFSSPSRSTSYFAETTEERDNRVNRERGRNRERDKNRRGFISAEDEASNFDYIPEQVQSPPKRPRKLATVKASKEVAIPETATVEQLARLLGMKMSEFQTRIPIA